MKKLCAPGVIMMIRIQKRRTEEEEYYVAAIQKEGIKEKSRKISLRTLLAENMFSCVY